jgi:acyl-coenzyme A thioesterase PaaI-like protein
MISPERATSEVVVQQSVDRREQPSQARLDAAAAARRLVHGLVGHHASDDDLVEVARVVGELAERVSAGERRVRPDDQITRFSEPVPEGGELSCWPDCMIAGVAHPYGTGLQGRREGDEAVVEVVLGPAHEGPPGRAHGGMVASLFDEVMGFALWMEAIPGYTAWLRVDYRAAMPLAEPLELRARVMGRDGRKVFLTGTATHDGRVLAEAEGLFVIPRDHATAG